MYNLACLNYGTDNTGKKIEYCEEWTHVEVMLYCRNVIYKLTIATIITVLTVFLNGYQGDAPALKSKIGVSNKRKYIREYLWIQSYSNRITICILNNFYSQFSMTILFTLYCN